jgi:uncharacterized protein YndB with AHSA1/START domain
LAGDAVRRGGYLEQTQTTEGKSSRAVEVRIPWVQLANHIARPGGPPSPLPESPHIPGRTLRAAVSYGATIGSNRHSGARGPERLCQHSRDPFLSSLTQARGFVCLPPRVNFHVNAPSGRAYSALLDPRAFAKWKVPDGMTCHVHFFGPREEGSFRISLTYGGPTGTGKTAVHTDTYHRHFARLKENEEVVEVDESETADPAFRGGMNVTITVSETAGGTDILALRTGLPRDVSTVGNETVWRKALGKLAALVEARPEAQIGNPSDGAFSPWPPFQDPRSANGSSRGLSLVSARPVPEQPMVEF